MRTISQRELRNDNAEVIRAVLEGETFLITRNGEPVAVLHAPDDVVRAPGLPLGRPARRRERYAGRPRVRGSVPTERLLDELRGDR
ncbi:MAG: type II toxin-antitoxin system Phd/YefM family antitoxin [Nocardioidaceae bacterium]|nr:type II toxin-antitoxin system Phd/YefM family antitoxin [Nocardioidaceae bacterium]